MSSMQSRMRLAYLLRTALPTATILLPLLGVLVAICIIWPLYVARDTQGAVRYMADARVVAVTSVPGTQYRDQFSEVTLHLSSIDETYPCYAPVSVGDRVRVTYRLGQSGHVYVDGIRRINP